MFKFYDTEFNRNMKPYVIAEIGHNHGGNFEKAKELILLAKQSGVQCVKFQKKDVENLYTKKMLNSSYNNPNSFADTYGDHKRFLEFNVSQLSELKTYSESLGLHFLCTAFDFKSVKDLYDIDIKGFKIGSCDLINTPLINYIASTRLPIFLSTGGSTLDEIDKAVQTIEKYHNKYVLLHCVSSYPADYNQLNLSFIGKLLSRYPNTLVGYSGHEAGILAPIVAYMLGATVFEKHFTFDRSAKGTDHRMSLEPHGMSKLVRNLQSIEESIGTGEKNLEDWELAARKKLGKSLYINGSVLKGDKVTIENVSIKAPGVEGLEPYWLDKVLGMSYNNNYEDEIPLTWDKLEEN